MEIVSKGQILAVVLSFNNFRAVEDYQKPMHAFYTRLYLIDMLSMRNNDQNDKLSIGSIKPIQLSLFFFLVLEAVWTCRR